MGGIEQQSESPYGVASLEANVHADEAATEGSAAPKSGSRQPFYRRGWIAHNFETRGILRVSSEERNDLKKLGIKQIGLLWFSINLAANNITLGMLGPAIFYLSFTDACLCAVFGMLVGCLPVAYIATFGPQSGLRSLVVARYCMGWWPAKIVVILNLIVLLGYALIDTVVAGQILSAVSPNGSLSVVVGIVIVTVITLIITTFGYHLVHYYLRYAWIPQMIVLSILAGVAGPKFDLTTPTQGDARTVAASRLSFFSLCLAAAITYSGGAADLIAYYPEDTPKWRSFTSVYVGLAASFAYAFIIGIGLASGATNNPAFAAAYETSQGALIVEGFRDLGNFGSFCSVVIMLGLIPNVILPTYISSVDFQILGRYAAAVPRIVWNLVGTVIYLVCALAGRDHLAEIFTNFLALMGYWTVIWIAIMLEEHFIFRRHKGFDWTAYNEPHRLPIGLAALLAFLIGWAGAILSMAQVWYIGPIARTVGEYGADMGNYVAFTWTLLVFPPLRWLELKKYRR